MCIIVMLVVLTISYINCFLSGNLFLGTKKLTGRDIELWKSTPAWNLAKAVEGEDTIKANRILAKGFSIDYREPIFGQNLLSWAVESNRVETVAFLLKKGANPNLHCHYDGESPVILAAKRLDVASNPEILRLLLKYGGNPNDHVKPYEQVSHEHSIKTPLTAAAYRSLRKVKLLLDAGAYIDFAIKDGETALYHAALGNKFDIIKYLLDKGADYRKVYTVTTNGDTLRFEDVLAKFPYQKTQENELLLKQIQNFIRKGGG